eukprot:SAG11_NODE_2496_length_3289_cov_91.547022_3_plen_160_part_01
MCRRAAPRRTLAALHLATPTQGAGHTKARRHHWRGRRAAHAPPRRVANCQVRRRARRRHLLPVRRSRRRLRALGAAAGGRGLGDLPRCLQRLDHPVQRRRGHFPPRPFASSRALRPTRPPAGVCRWRGATAGDRGHGVGDRRLRRVLRLRRRLELQSPAA